MKNRVLLTAITAGLLGTSMAHAHGDRDPGKMFDALDANDNGQLSQEELSNMHEAMARLRFQSADSNDDGKIDRDEFMAKAEQRAERMFERMDDNDDGTLDADEAQPHHGGKHHKSGKHHDGDKPHHDKSEDKDKGEHRKDGHGDRKGKHAEKMLERMDSDDDGSVSRDEWDDAMERAHERHGDKKTDDQ